MASILVCLMYVFGFFGVFCDTIYYTCRKVIEIGMKFWYYRICRKKECLKNSANAQSGIGLIVAVLSFVGIAMTKRISDQ